jgi:serine/threonine-protein kinase
MMQNPSQRHIRPKRLGRYQVLEELARDADGIVYRARDPLLDRLVAIKTVARAPDAQSHNADFERKVKLAGGLAHPNIVTVHDAGISRDVAYMAMELVDGATLHDTLHSGVDLQPAAIERIAAQVAVGLEFMHGHAIVHGDVNPCNVVVLAIGFVKISYLGNALFPIGWSMPADRVSPASQYLSPEHVMGGALDARSDVFSLGVVLYEMLTGVAPFSGSTSQQLVDAIRNKHPPPPSVLNPGIPSGFDYIVARALSKQPEHRYQSARDMAQHLRRWALEESTFFAMPRRTATAAHGALAAAAEQAPCVATAAAAPSAVLPDSTPVRQATLRTRRQWLLYGVPAALLTMTTAWTLWSRPTSTQRVLTESPESPNAAVPDTPKTPDAQPVQVRDASPPTTGSTETQPVISPTSEPPGALVERPPLGRVKLAVTPWGEIYVDGRKRGVTPPLRHIELAPGRHRIEIKNTIFPPRRELVEVRANGQLRIKHKFKR